MTEPPWRDGDDRRPPERGQPGAYPEPDRGAYDRDRALYRDDRGAYADDDGVWEDLYRPPSPAGPAPRRWGALPGMTCVCIVIGAAALGALITALTGSQPGLVLGVLLVGGTITAALAVRSRAAYLIIPVPALAYVVAATLAGLVSDRAAGTSGTALAVNGAQWIASGFVAMTVATGIAIVITLARWYTSRRGHRDPARPGRGSEGTGHDPRHPRHGPGAAGEGRRRPQAARSRSTPRHRERDPDSPVAARDPRDAKRTYPGALADTGRG
jgi:hypothetical protein